MQSVGLFEAKNKFSELCGRVAARRKPITILRRGRPLVRIVPLEEEGESEDVWSARERFADAGGRLSDEIVLPRRRREGRAVPFIDADES